MTTMAVIIMMTLTMMTSHYLLGRSRLNKMVIGHANMTKMVVIITTTTTTTMMTSHYLLGRSRLIYVCDHENMTMMVVAIITTLTMMARPARTGRPKKA